METLSPTPPPAAAPAGAPGETPPPKKEGAKAAAKNAIRQLLPLVLILVGVKMFVADIRVIPSGSMEPTLHGRPNSGDRILFRHFFGSRPQRWEVFVFKFPYEESLAYGCAPASVRPFKGEDFIKRCVGLPGEELALVNGDVFTRANAREPARRQVKPDSLQRRLWLPVYREGFARLTPEELAVFWEGAAAPGVTIAGATLKIAAPAPLKLRFQPHDRSGRTGSVLDRYIRRQAVTYTCPHCRHQTRQTVFLPQMSAHCGHCGQYLTEADVTYYDYFPGYPRPEMPPAAAYGNDGNKSRDVWHRVRDLRWRGRARLSPGAVVAAELYDDDRVARAEFRAEGDGQATVALSLDGREAPGTRAGFALPSGHWAELEFYRCDGEYRAFVDGKPLFCAAPDGHAMPASRMECQTSGVGLSVQGAAEFQEIAVDRDIHYFSRSRLPVFIPVPEDGYLGFGDNCPASNDSRDWGPVPEKNLVGKAVAVWWPLDAMRIIH
ncbi:MAG: signal peptidase I [Planctomycetes bacterium]|nr:signal peptidase I [Planctomycetota bacterium]